MAEKIKAHILVSGIVQGVFFRAETQRKARQLGLTGWVKNLDDSRVEAVFEGEKNKVEQMIEWAKKGPSGAFVAHLELKWEKSQDEFNSFEVRY